MGVTFSSSPAFVRVPSAGGGGGSEAAHDFYNELLLRGDYWSGKTLSFRNQTLINSATPGGTQPWVTYSPGTDTDLQKQDAARVIIPAFVVGGTNTVGAPGIPNGTDTSFPMALGASNHNSLNAIGQSIRIDSEIMLITNYTGGDPSTVSVSRGMYGTSGVSHTTGTPVYVSSNKLPAQTFVPTVTADGNTYLYTWDYLMTSSYTSCGLSGLKLFQVYQAGDVIWWEIRPIFGGDYLSNVPPEFTPGTHVALYDVRSYNSDVGSETDWTLTNGLLSYPTSRNSGGSSDPLAMASPNFFSVLPNVWHRFFVRIEQIANDWDRVTMWINDETHSAVKIFDRIRVSVGPTGSNLSQWGLEGDSSDDIYKQAGRASNDLVSYIRNMAVLKATGLASAGTLDDTAMATLVARKPVRG